MITVFDLWIQLDKKLCDLGKPVVVKEVTRDGEREVFRGLPKLSLRVLVESVGVRNDPEMAYVARVQVR